MCEPATIALTVAAVAQVAGGTVAGMGAIAQGKAANQAAQQQSRELQYQAELERQRKKVEDANAENDLQTLGLQAQAERASALTGFAASGQTIANGGFVQRYLDDSARVTSKEENVVRWNRDVANWGHDANANSLENQSVLTRMEGKRAKRAGWYSATGSVLDGIAKGSKTIAGAF